MAEEVSAKVGGFRVGLLRPSSRGAAYKPAAYVGLASDGGVFVVPYPKRSAWTYGVLRSDGPTHGEHVRIDTTPKLHYHRSGIVSVTLTGCEDLERRRLQLQPLHSLKQAQVLSIVTSRTWELPTRIAHPQIGDMHTTVRRWPNSAAWSIFLMGATSRERSKLLQPGLGALGLLRGGDRFTHAVVSLAAYGWEAVLIITTQTDYGHETPPGQGGTTVAALDWRAGKMPRSAENFGLWSAGLRNPVVNWKEELPATLEPVGDVVTRVYRRARGQ